MAVPASRPAARLRLALLVPGLLLAVLLVAGWLLLAERAATPVLLRATAEILAAAAEQSRAAPAALDALPAGWGATITDARGSTVAARGAAAGQRLQHAARSTGGWGAVVSAPRPLPLGWLAAAAVGLLLAAAAASRAVERRLQAASVARDTAQQRALRELENGIALADARVQHMQQHMFRCQRLEVLGRLVGNAVHEFNNVLGVVGNSTQLLQRRVATPDGDLPLAALNRAVDKGSELTRALATFANRRPGVVQPCDLARRLPDLAEPMRMVLGKRVALSISVAPGTRRTAIDDTELELVLINLALNARDALPAGGGLWLDAHNADAADGGAGCVQLNVTDDGAGIADDVAARAFDPYFTTRAGASGLGLAQVRAFCERAGGSARIAGTPGMGTTVSLLLPSEGSAGAGSPRSGNGGSAAQPDDQLRDRRLLLVDDNEELAHVTAMLLSAYGCIVEVANSAAQALALVETGTRFDIVLSDVVMPGDIDGVALAMQLRRRLPALPVVLISGYSSALASVPDFVVLQKPCSPQQLIGALARALAPADPPQR